MVNGKCSAASPADTEWWEQSPSCTREPLSLVHQAFGQGRASSPSRREASARTPSSSQKCVAGAEQPPALPARRSQTLLRSYFCPCQRWEKPFGLLNIE